MCCRTQCAQGLERTIRGSTSGGKKKGRAEARPHICPEFRGALREELFDVVEIGWEKKGRLKPVPTFVLNFEVRYEKNSLTLSRSGGRKKGRAEARPHICPTRRTL